MRTLDSRPITLVQPMLLPAPPPTLVLPTAAPPDSQAPPVPVPAPADARAPGGSPDAPAYIEPPDDPPPGRTERTRTASGAPRPVGTAPDDGDSFFGTWVRPMGLRGMVSFGFGGGSLVVDGQPSSTNQSADWRAEAAGSLAILDRRVLAVDYAVGFQNVGADTLTAATESRNTLRAANLSLAATLLAGRSMPLRVYFNRASTGSRTSVLLPETPESLQDATGSHSTVGAGWDLNIPSLPKVRLLASQDSRSDERNWVFGQSQWTTQRLAEARVTDNRAAVSYDASYRLEDYRLTIPDVAIDSQTSQQMLAGSLSLQPVPTWRVDLGGRMNRYTFGANTRLAESSGSGVNGVVRFMPTRRLFASASYALSTNATEALLSGNLDPGQIPADIAGPSSIRHRFAAVDAEARVGYAHDTASIESFARYFSLGVPNIGPATLSRQQTVGMLVRADRRLAGFHLNGLVEGEFGTAISTRSTEEPIQAGGVQASLSRQAGSVLSFTLEGAASRRSRVIFYPGELSSQSAGVRVEAQRPAWARLSAGARWFDVVRDSGRADFNDRFAGWSAGVSGRRYNVSAEVNGGDAHSLSLSPNLLARRVDLAILLDRQPEWFGALLLSTVRSRQVSARIEPWRRLQIQGIVLRESRSYPGLFDQAFDTQQISLVYALRQVQLEAGWGRYAVASSLASGDYRNQRFFVRARRDITIF